MPVKHELELSYKRDLLSKPLISVIARTYDVMFNLVRASVTHQTGRVIFHLSGDKPEVEAAEKLLSDNGVDVRILSDHMLHEKLPNIPRCQPQPPEGQAAERKLWITIEHDLVEVPVLWEMSRRFDLEFDIRQACIGHDIGVIGMLIYGHRDQLNGACTFLFSKGVAIEPIEREYGDHT